MTEIPLLEASDVELRVAQIKETNYGVYVTLLCYKDARCDMRVLDAIYGPMNWQRSHELINDHLFCTVSVWDEAKQQWIKKQDVGTESNTEATKGEASDAFKRSCVSWGIGRELYEAPDIRFKLNESEVSSSGSYGKPKCYAKFHVGEMVYDKSLGRFTAFTVLDEDGNVRFDLSRVKSKKNYVPSKPAEQMVPAPDEDIPFLPEEEMQQPVREEPQEPVRATAPANNAGTGYACLNCGVPIKSEKVMSFAMKRFKKPLCYNCQKKIG